MRFRYPGTLIKDNCDSLRIGLCFLNQRLQRPVLDLNYDAVVQDDGT